ncbi:hypothetical protein ABT095_24075 [Kitasatospora sp. NPDC002227]|uniref:hypothetical protein n=1 Tax=Kitasatospora sp. NPDC002227 TaxID=3154773 RepID=UPI00331F2A66
MDTSHHGPLRRRLGLAAIVACLPVLGAGLWGLPAVGAGRPSRLRAAVPQTV